MRFAFGNRHIDFEDRTLVMAILNVTPDSFSDGGDCLNAGCAIKQAGTFLEEGATIIDVGGESTRPGSSPISAEEEMQRVIPVIRGIRRKYGSSPVISIDTSKTSVAEAALESGAEIVNDVTALTTGGDALCSVLAKYRAGCILMHNSPLAKESGCIDEIFSYLSDRLDYAMSQSGLGKEHFMLDAGIGFQKRLQQNLICCSLSAELRKLGCPVLLGASRKSFLGQLTGRAVQERDYATTALTAIASYNGIEMVRVHNVPAAMDAISIANAMKAIEL